MTALNLTRERADFEAWMLNEKKCIVSSSDPYVERLIADRWDTWQASRRAALAQSPVSAEGLGWIDSKLRPPEPGLIVKRWNGGSVWAGIYRGDAKGSSCDWWMPLPGDV